MRKIFICITMLALFMLLLCSCQTKNSAASLYSDSLNDSNEETGSVVPENSLTESIESNTEDSVIMESSESETEESTLKNPESIVSSITSSPEGVDEWIDTNASQTKEEEINGETLVFKYSISKKSTGVQIHDRDVYVAENGAVVNYDRVTGQLVSFISVNNITNKKNISENEANSIAENFIKYHCDITKYTYIETKYSEYGEYTINYSKMINGLKTSEIICVVISFDGKIISFVYNPYVFDNVTVPEFNETEIISKLENDIKTGLGDKYIGYEINDKRICLDENGKPAMEFFVSRKYMQNGEECSDGYNYVYTL